MSIASIIVLAVYGLCLTFIFLYSLTQLHLTILYWKQKKQAIPAPLPQQQLPKVTIQLPLYNERYVVERLLQTIAQFDYPSELLQVQILNDSTDDTTALVEAQLLQLSATGITFEHIRRPDRTGYKAGALQYGLPKATGEFISIFDADFVPDPDFLLKTVAAFTAANIGVVQTRWGHLNQDYSLLTRLQAFGLNAHFTVEQTGRETGRHFLNFNGTAGVWRKQCIVDAGGWQADTLTEDLDLSYRAQLKGWQIVYLEEVEAPAELPAAMGALKSQQFRWTKGAAETARKHLLRVLQAPLPLATKLHAMFHLLNSGVFICVLLTALLSTPILFIKQQHPELNTFFQLGYLLLLSLVGLICFYWTAQHQQSRSFWKTTKVFIPDFFLFLSMSMGLSLHNSIAVLEGYLGKKTPFVRTPKYNLVGRKDSWRQRGYFMTSLSPVTVAEGLLSLYFGAGLVFAFRLQDFSLLPFQLLLTLGFGSVFLYSFFHSKRS